MIITPLLKKLCAIAGKYNSTKGAYTPSSGEGAFVVKTMEKLAEELQQCLVLSTFGKLSVAVSKGQGNVPKVLWIAILPAGKTVGNSASVTICFGRQGEGLVAGLMVPKGGGHLLITPLKRKADEIRVNVDGDREGTRYSNCYINPKEWLVAELDESGIIEHLTKSVELLVTKEIV